jgi:hypothetical protein
MNLNAFSFWDLFVSFFYKDNWKLIVKKKCGSVFFALIEKSDYTLKKMFSLLNRFLVSIIVKDDRP